MPVELSIQPMTDLERSVLADETCLYKHIGKFSSRYVSDGLLYSELRLPDNIRDSLLPPLPFLQLTQRCCVGRINYFDRDESHQWTIDQVMIAALGQKKKPDELRVHLAPASGINPDLKDKDDSLFIRESDAKSGLPNVKVFECLINSASKVGSYLGVYNPYNQTHKSASIEYQTGQYMILACGDGVVLKNVISDEGEQYWERVAKYSHVTKSVQMNPLLQENLDSAHKTVSNGAYYLPVRAVLDLSEVKRKSRKSPPLFICGTGKDENSLKSFKETVSKSLSDPGAKVGLSMLFMNSRASHMTMVRLIQMEGKIVVYLHETILPECPVATEIRHFVINGVSQAIKSVRNHHPLCFLTTPASEYLQADYKSCTTIAIKVLVAFDKPRNNLDSSLVSLATNDQSTPVAVNYHAFDAVNSEEKPRKGWLLDKDVRVGGVLLTSLPAVLLKMYQGRQDKLSNSQKRTVVSYAKNLTLEQYYKKHSFKGSDSEQLLNVAASGKADKYFVLWKDMLRNFTPLFRKALDDNFDRISKDVINRWLAKSMCGHVEISAKDLKMLKLYRNFMTKEADIHLWPEDMVRQWWFEKKDLKVWLVKITSDKETSDLNKLLRLWCQYINDNLDPKSEVGMLWVGKDVEFVVDRLEGRLSLFPGRWKSDYSFHYGEKIYREPSCPLEYTVDKNVEAGYTNSFVVRTAIKESKTESQRFNRIVMSFPRFLVNEKPFYDSGSETSEAILESVPALAYSSEAESINGSWSDTSVAKVKSEGSIASEKSLYDVSSDTCEAILDPVSVLPYSSEEEPTNGPWSDTSTVMSAPVGVQDRSFPFDVAEEPSRLELKSSASQQGVGDWLSMSERSELIDIEGSSEGNNSDISGFLQYSSQVKPSTPDKPEPIDLETILLEPETSASYSSATAESVASCQAGRETLGDIVREKTLPIILFHKSTREILRAREYMEKRSQAYQKQFPAEHEEFLKSLRAQAMQPVKRERSEPEGDSSCSVQKKQCLTPNVHNARQSFEAVLKRAAEKHQVMGNCYRPLPTKQSGKNDIYLQGLTQVHDAPPPMMKILETGTSMAAGEGVPSDLAMRANSLRKKIEKSEWKLEFKTLSMTLNGQWKLDGTSTAKASNKSKILKQAVQKICDISNRTNELDNFLGLQNVFAFPDLNRTQKANLKISYTLDYLFQILNSVGAPVNNEPLDIIKAAKIFIVQNYHKIGYEPMQ
ncbi:hypothetical protein [Endozoicomonas elysicola]|uniref:Uncharacterized protein n=1 Tax=Endozoicomonas elysicola TaxID=305900 RepID=A0A081K8W6_9GAMM|nr:hypothetical protein [Endozoicomonas elysicola]KEI70592.1 hypothetical protein GV64_07430 [Endozoicomonas elysicola]